MVKWRGPPVPWKAAGRARTPLPAISPERKMAAVMMPRPPWEGRCRISGIRPVGIWTRMVLWIYLLYNLQRVSSL